MITSFRALKIIVDVWNDLAGKSVLISRMVITFENDGYWVAFDTYYQFAGKGETEEKAKSNLDKIFEHISPDYKVRPKFRNKYEVAPDDIGVVLKLSREVEDFVYETSSLIPDRSGDRYVFGFPVLRGISDTHLYEVLSGEKLERLPDWIKKDYIYKLECDLAVLKGTPLPNPPGFPADRSYDAEFKKYGTVIYGYPDESVMEETYRKYMVEHIIDIENGMKPGWGWS